MNLQFREQEYFTENTIYFYDNNLKTVKEATCVKDKGFYWLDNYKATSVKAELKINK